MKKLVAKIPILFQGRMYEAGEALPAYEPKMVDAWLRAKSAEMIGDEKPYNPHDITGSMITPEDPQGSQDGEDAIERQDGEETADLQETSLSLSDLEKMEKDDLIAIAQQKGIQLPRGASKVLVLEKLLASVPADDGNTQ